MRRLHLVELEDQPWFPRPVRDAATAYLRFAMQLSGQTNLLAERLAPALRSARETRLLDLCSGGGGPFPALLDGLAAEGVRATARLCDRYPNLAALRDVAEASGGRVEFVSKPVDATAVPRELAGFRTLFNSFHHFRPEMARAILADAVRARRPIGVFEVVGREPFILVNILFAPLVVLLAMPFVRPRRWSWVFFTYVIPLVPLLILWDGLVSCLRVYSPDELRELVRGLGDGSWRWEIGRVRFGRIPAHATYLIGMPAREAT